MSPTVDALNRSAIDIRMPRTVLIRPASTMASIERPPRSKKSLPVPHLTTPSTWANSLAQEFLAGRGQQRLPGVGMQLRDVQAGAGRCDEGDQALAGRAGVVLDDRDVGKPGKGRQGCSDFTDAFGIH